MTKKVKALKDPYFRREQKIEAENPAGNVELKDEQLDEAKGGTWTVGVRVSIRACKYAVRGAVASYQSHCVQKAWKKIKFW